jgi:hypothetical protein
MTPTEYLASLTPDRRATLAAVRKVVRKHMPKGYQEAMNWGGITWEVPLSRFPKTPNGQPVCRADAGLRTGREEVRHGQVLPALQPT